MGQITVTKAPIDGLYVIEPTVHGDSRGYFVETYNQHDMHDWIWCLSKTISPCHARAYCVGFTFRNNFHKES